MTYGPYGVPERAEPTTCGRCGKHYVTRGYGHEEYERDRVAIRNTRNTDERGKS